MCVQPEKNILPLIFIVFKKRLGFATTMCLQPVTVFLDRRPREGTITYWNHFIYWKARLLCFFTPSRPTLLLFVVSVCMLQLTKYSPHSWNYHLGWIEPEMHGMNQGTHPVRAPHLLSKFWVCPEVKSRWKRTRLLWLLCVCCRTHSEVRTHIVCTRLLWLLLCVLPCIWWSKKHIICTRLLWLLMCVAVRTVK
jgi:hypothetical protein